MAAAHARDDGSQANPRRADHSETYLRLREAITGGRFQPNERLVEAQLVDLLGAGRSSIRAALVRLDQEGLVTRQPNRGARVRLISGREAVETGWKWSFTRLLLASGDLEREGYAKRAARRSASSSSKPIHHVFRPIRTTRRATTRTTSRRARKTKAKAIRRAIATNATRFSKAA